VAILHEPRAGQEEADRARRLAPSPLQLRGCFTFPERTQRIRSELPDRRDRLGRVRVAGEELCALPRSTFPEQGERSATDRFVAIGQQRERCVEPGHGLLALEVLALAEVVEALLEVLFHAGEEILAILLLDRRQFRDDEAA
jgi:hypothetical protein